MIWQSLDGKDEKKEVQHTENIKEMFLEYVQHLIDYSQNNAGMPLCLLNYSRTQMHRREFIKRAIYFGAINIIGELGIGKSTTVIFVGKQ